MYVNSIQSYANGVHIGIYFIENTGKRSGFKGSKL